MAGGDTRQFDENQMYDKKTSTEDKLQQRNINDNAFLGGAGEGISDVVTALGKGVAWGLDEAGAIDPATSMRARDYLNTPLNATLRYTGADEAMRQRPDLALAGNIVAPVGTAVKVASMGLNAARRTPELISVADKSKYIRNSDSADTMVASPEQPPIVTPNRDATPEQIAAHQDARGAYKEPGMTKDVDRIPDQPSNEPLREYNYRPQNSHTVNESSQSVANSGGATEAAQRLGARLDAEEAYIGNFNPRYPTTPAQRPVREDAQFRTARDDYNDNRRDVKYNLKNAAVKRGNLGNGTGLGLGPGYPFVALPGA